MLKRFKYFLRTWKPIPLCWWFEQRGLPVPKYLIGGAATAPSVTTDGESSLLKYGATLNGTVTSNGGATLTARGFVYSLTSVNNNPSIGGTGVTNVVEGGTTVSSFSSAVTGLTANSGYSYKAYATNSKGTSYGSVDTFTTNNLTSVALNSPDNAATITDTTPDLVFTGTDPDGLGIAYNVQVSTTNEFGTGNVNLGNTTEETTTEYYTKSTIRTVEHTSSSSGRTVSVVAYVYATTATNARAVLYKASDLSIVDYSSEVSIPTSASPSWRTFNLNSVSIESGTAYRIGLWCEDARDLWTKSGTGKTAYTMSQAYSSTNAPPSTLTDDSSSSNVSLAVYLVYDNSTAIIDALSDTDTGFSGTDPYASGAQVTYTVQSALSAGTYYWRVAGKDPSGSNTYGAWATTRSFTVSASVAERRRNFPLWI